MKPTPPFGPDFFADPFVTFAELRRAPMQKIRIFTQDAWLVTRFDDVMMVLKDQRFALTAPQTAAAVPPDSLASPILTFPHLLSTDGFDHRRLRDLVSKGFTPRFVEDLRPMVQQLAHTLIDQIQASGTREFDLISTFAFPLPIRIISNMLGLPPEDQERFHQWTTVIMNNLADVEANTQFIAYLQELFEHKRQQPGTDLISALVRVGEDGDVLSERELIGMVMLLTIAGHETTSNLLGNGMLALLTRPSTLARLRAQPEQLPAMVEELLRLEGPVTLPVPRYALEDVRVGDQMIQAGDALMLALASADRDEHRFADAAELDVARSLNQHLAFGQGVHYCLGAPLARMEAQEGLAALLARFPELALDAEPSALLRTSNPFLRGLRALPLRY